MNDWHDALSALSSQFEPLQPETEAVQEPAVTEEKQTAPLHIALERKGRAGKTATIVYGFTISDERIDQVAASLKRSLGCGGSSRGGEILLQGDRQSQLRPLLAALGFKVK